MYFVAGANGLSARRPNIPFWRGIVGDVDPAVTRASWARTRGRRTKRIPWHGEIARWRPHLQRIDIGFTTAGLENTGPFRELIRFYEIDYWYDVYVLYARTVEAISLPVRKLPGENNRVLAVENGIRRVHAERWEQGKQDVQIDQKRERQQKSRYIDENGSVGLAEEKKNRDGRKVK